MISSAVGGATTGMLVAMFGVAASSVLGETSLFVAAFALALAALIREARGGLGRWPERKAQVPRHWLLWDRREGTAVAFGLMIGCGALTFLEHAAAYALVAIVLVSPVAWAGVGVGALYGFTRSVPLLITWLGHHEVVPVINWYGLLAREGVIRVAVVTSTLGSLIGVLAVLN